MPLAHSSALASSSKRWTVMTGPKISFWIISSSWRRPSITVGSTKKPGESGCLPPVTTRVWSGRRSRKPVTLPSWRAELTGPSVVSGSNVSPSLSARACSASASTTSSCMRADASTRVAAVQSWPAL